MREVNNRIVDVLPQPRLSPGIDVLCECVDDRCTERLAVTADDYERVRARPRWFLVRPDHMIPGLERIVWEGDHFVVVEKLGEAGAAAAEADEHSSAA